MASAPQQDVGEVLSDVNVIPLADVTLVLLIIMMVISPMIMLSMIKVQSSRATTVKSLDQNPPEPPLILALNPSGISLNTVKINSELELVSKISEALAGRSDKTILLTVDPAYEHGKFVTILDLLKQHGAEKIALLKKRTGGKP